MKRTKVEVALFIFLLIGISANSVFGTVTITDINTTTDENTLEINFQGNWIDVNNQTIRNNLDVIGNVTIGGNLTVDDFILSDLLPNPTLTLDFGSGANRWEWLYVSNVSSDNLNATIGIGTPGDLYVGGNANIIGDFSLVGDTTIGGNLTVDENLHIDGITVMGAGGFLVSPTDTGASIRLNITQGGDIYTQGTWTNDGNIVQAGSYWLYNLMGLLYPHVHMWSGGIEVYDGTVSENVVINLTNAGDIVATGNITADNAWISQYVFAHTDVNISVDVAGTWYNISFNRSESLKHGILHNYDDDTNDTFTIAETGIYDLHGHLSFQDSAATPDSNIVFRFTKNDVEITGSIREYDLDKKDWDTLGSTTVFASLTAGDEIKLQFTSDDTTVRLDSDFTYGDHQDTAVVKIKRIG